MTTHSSFRSGERVYGNGDQHNGVEFAGGVEPPAPPDPPDHDSLQREVAGNAIIHQALQKLLRAWQFSIDCDRSNWDFAVELADLDTLGVSHDELRWLIGKNLVEHAQEIDSVQGIGRSFESPGGFTFSSKSCFVITATARQLLEGTICPTLDQTVEAPRSPAVLPVAPVWDDQRHELRLGQVLVKRFKWRASNQEAILSAFEEDGWPARIDDPLPPVPDTDPKRRLSDTIKCLNRKQQNALVRFSGDGTGEGVLWDVVSADEPAAGH